MSRGLKRKFVFLIIFASALIFYVRTVPQVSLNERAIVVGMGIDYEEGEYTVSTQIVNPIQSGQANNMDDSYGVVYAKGKTIAECIGQISQLTGLKVSLSQCNLLIWGKGIVNENMIPSIGCLVQTYQFPEQAYMLVAENKAVDILRAKPLMTKISAFQIQQTLNSMADDESVINTNLKNFLGDYLSDSGAAIVAYIIAEEVAKEDSGGSMAEGENSKYHEFNYDKGILFSKKRPPLLLEKDDTVAANLILEKIKSGGLTVNVDGVDFNLELNEKKYKLDLKLVDGRVKYDGKIKIKYSISEAGDINGYFSLSDITEELKGKIADAAAKEIERKINAAYEKCKAAGYDIYMIYNKIYAKEGVKWKSAAREDYLNQVDFSISAEVEIRRT